MKPFPKLRISSEIIKKTIDELLQVDNLKHNTYLVSCMDKQNCIPFFKLFGLSDVMKLCVSPDYLYDMMSSNVQQFYKIDRNQKVIRLRIAQGRDELRILNNISSDRNGPFREYIKQLLGNDSFQFNYKGGYTTISFNNHMDMISVWRAFRLVDFDGESIKAEVNFSQMSSSPSMPDNLSHRKKNKNHIAAQGSPKRKEQKSLFNLDRDFPRLN